eukprot:353273-Chlamydomonas_euryale.AAC.19
MPPAPPCAERMRMHAPMTRSRACVLLASMPAVVATAIGSSRRMDRKTFVAHTLLRLNSRRHASPARWNLHGLCEWSWARRVEASGVSA